MLAITKHQTLSVFSCKKLTKAFGLICLLFITSCNNDLDIVVLSLEGEEALERICEKLPPESCDELRIRHAGIRRASILANDETIHGISQFCYYKGVKELTYEDIMRRSMFDMKEGKESKNLLSEYDK